MSTNNTSTNGGVSFVGLLGIAFIVLKLTHIISWPWIWVLAPFWVGIALAVVIGLIALIVWSIAKAALRAKR